MTLKRWLLVACVLVASAAVSAVGVAGLMDASSDVDCAAVKAEGTALRERADREPAESVRLTNQMFALVDGNRSCFTDVELANVETARRILTGAGSE